METFAPSSTPRVEDSAIEKIEVKFTHYKKKVHTLSKDKTVSFKGDISIFWGWERRTPPPFPVRPGTGNPTSQPCLFADLGKQRK